MAFRRKELWMARGSVVCLPLGKGVVEGVVECVGSAEFLPGGSGLLKDRKGNYYPRERMVMQLYVRPEGVGRAWPFNPWDVEKAA